MDKLTFTRFLAALSVVLTHFGRDIPFIDDAPWSHFLRQGSFMVSYFFVLSGFIMAAVYWDIEGSGQRRAYWVARFARIYPVYLLALVFMMSLDTLNGPRPVAAFVLNATLVQAWFPGFAMTGNPPGWSLSTEAFFYLVFPFCMPLLKAMPGVWRPLLAVGSIWIVSQLGYHFGLQALEASPGEWLHNALHYQPILHLNSFLAGMAASLVLRRMDWAPVMARPRTGAPFVMVLASTILVLAALWWLGEGVRVGGAFVSAANGLLAPLFAVFIAALAADTSPWTRWLGWAPLVALGEMSYGVYILQDPMREIVYRFGTGPVHIDPVPLFWTFIVALLVVSAAVWRWFESPLRRILRARFGSPPQQRAERAAMV